MCNERYRSSLNANAVDHVKVLDGFPFAVNMFVVNIDILVTCVKTKILEALCYLKP